MIEALEVGIIFKTENVLSEEQKGDENYDLVDCLANDVAIHHSVKNGIVDRMRLVFE